MARVIDTRRSRILLGGLVVSHLMVISNQVDGGGGASLLERALFQVLSPIQLVASRGVRAVGAAWENYVDLRGAREENLRLRSQVRGLETDLEWKEQEAAEASRLRELLDLKPRLHVETLVAEVVARDTVPFFRTLTINKGSQEGVHLNAAVLSPKGVVGRVVALGREAAKVQLLMDRESGVSVIVQRSRATGVVKGQVGFGDSGNADLLLKYIPALADLEPGDLVVTSGLDRIYPKGIVVGRVRSIGTSSGLFRDPVFVATAVSFDSLEEVLVLRSSLDPSPDGGLK